MLGLKICCKTSKIVLNVGGFFYLTYKYQIRDLTMDVTNTRNGERGTGNGERGTGNRSLEMNVQRQPA